MFNAKKAQGALLLHNQTVLWWGKTANSIASRSLAAGEAAAIPNSQDRGRQFQKGLMEKPGRG